MYEIQAITAQLDTTQKANGPLYRFDIVVEASAQDFTATNMFNFFLDIGVSMVGDVISNTHPVISSSLVAGKTIYDMISTIDDSIISPTTVVSDITVAYEFSMNTTMKYIFVKPLGTSDDGNQILGYMGNKTNFYIECSVPGFNTEIIDGELQVIPDEYIETGSVKSKGFDNSYNMAGQTFYKYNELGYYEHQLDIDNCISSVSLNCLIDRNTNMPALETTIGLPILYVW